MALVRNPLAMRMRGRAGAYSFYTESGRQIVRVAQNSSNYGETARRSTAQQRRRVMWANLVNFYKLSKFWMRGAFEFKKQGQSDYNVFMSLNIASARVALTKDMALHGECAVDLFRISDGSLPTISRGFSEPDSNFMTNIRFSGEPNMGTYTVAQFTQAIITDNPWITEGYQFSIIIVSDANVAGGRNFVNVAAHELTLSLTDSRIITEVLPVTNLMHDAQGFLGFGGLSNGHCTAVVLSSSTTGQLKVSPEYLHGGSIAEAIALSQPAAVEAAVNSYGVDEERFLDSGDMYTV